MEFYRRSAALLAVVLAFPVPPASAKQSGAQQLSEIVSHVEADPALAEINKDEALVEELRRAVLEPWASAWKAGDAAAFEALGPARLSWASASRSLRRDKDGIREYRWALKETKRGEAKKYLARFERLDDVRLDALKLVPGPSGATLDVRFDVRGVTAKGGRRHDRGELRLGLVREGAAWRLASIAPLKTESLESDRPVFVEATAAWGLDGVPVTDRREAIRRGGYAVATADYDGDGRPDLLVGGWGPVKLYRNTGSRFEDATEAAGLRPDTLVKSAAIVDLDNDGRRDLVMLRFVEGRKDENGDMVVYRNVGEGKFERKADVLTQTRRYDRAMPITVADFDRNGTLDLYLGFPGNKDFTYMSPDPKPLATQGVWLNDGKWGFLEAPRKSGIWKDDGLYPHSAIATDLNGDGLPDLVVMNDRAGLSPIYRNDGGGLFSEVSKKSGVENQSWAMSAIAGDYDGDGFPDLALTNIDFTAAHRILASREGRSTKAEELLLGRLRNNAVGNRLYRNRGDGTFEETTDKAGVRWAGDATAGAAWLDYSNSGRQDLYVMNGLWSGGRHDLSSLFVRLHANRTAAYADRVLDNALTSPMLTNEPSTNSPMLEVLRTVRGSVAEPAKAEGPLPSMSMGGEQRNAMFRNNQDGTFTEVGYLLGADRVEDGYVVSLADVDGDGNQDMILRNGDPAPGRSFGSVSLLLNKTPRKGHRSLTAFVEGDKSNRDGIGARVTVWVGGRKIVREVSGPTGASQSEPVAFFGLGSADSVDQLEVRWPSGLTETFEGVMAGRVMLREGKGYTPVLAARP